MLAEAPDTTLDEMDRVLNPRAKFARRNSQLTAPMIEDGDLLLAESGAIVEYIIMRHGGGRLRLDPSHPDYANYLYWFHFSNGNLQPVMSRLMMVSRAGLPADHPVPASVQMRFDRVMQVVDARLREATYFAGSEFTAADIMSFLAHHDAAFSAVHPAVPPDAYTIKPPAIAPQDLEHRSWQVDEQ